MQSLSNIRYCYRSDGVSRLLVNLFPRFNHHSTIDTSDVEHHSKLADGWWNPQGPVAPLHSLNQIRYKNNTHPKTIYILIFSHFFQNSVPFIRDGLAAKAGIDKNKINSAKPLEDVKILEIGCGAGILTEV